MEQSTSKFKAAIFFSKNIKKKNQDEIDEELRMLMMKITMELMRMMIMKNIKCFTRKKSTNQQIINK